jgi:hypothetical protein
MSTLGEPAATPWGAVLHEGLDTLSFDQVIVFDLYVRLVLPIDGYVFWVKAAELEPSAVLNAMLLNGATLNTPLESIPSPSFVAKGSFHYGTDSQQNIESNFAKNSVVFSSEQPIQDLNQTGPGLLYIGTFDAPTPASSNPPASTSQIRFAFSGRGSYYQQMNLWHYYGDAVYSTMASQIIDNPSLLATSNQIVSNSLPFWLNFNMYDPPWPVPVPRPNIPLFPSMLVPENMTSPFGAVHIEAERTHAVQAAPFLNRITSHYQLADDEIRLTVYGADNNMCQDFLDSFLQYSYDTEYFGIKNSPVFRDEKEGQNELNTIAKKKTAVFEISYVQSAARDLARQLILSCTPVIRASDVIIFNQEIL